MLAAELRHERDDEAVTALRERVLAHRGKVPPIAAWAVLRHTIRRALALSTPALALLVEGVEGWPELVEKTAPRAGLAVLATDLLVMHPQRSRKRVRALIRTSHRLLSLVPPAAATAPWHDMLTGFEAPTVRSYRSVDTRTEADRPLVAQTYYDAVRRWYETAPGKAPDAFRDRHLSRVTFGLSRLRTDEEWVVDRGEALLAQLPAAKLGHHALDGWLHFAHALTDDREAFVGLVKCLAEHDLTEDLDEDDTPLASLASLPDESRALLARMVLRGEPRAALRIAGRRDALVALGATIPELAVPPPARARPWMRVYPPLFRGALRRLQGVDRSARKTAEQILGRTFPRPEKLDVEIAALRRRIEPAPDPERLRVRLTRQLERRRALDRAPHTVEGMSGTKLVRLIGKLDQAADRHTLATWETELGVHLDEALGYRLRIPEVPSWLSEPPMTDLWPHLMQLDAGDRHLALRLLKVRSGPYPWDLRDAAPNRRFVERLVRAGIDAGPWVDGVGVRRHAHARGEIFLQLERDPIEVFRMGHYFGTCLSPGDMNFFSTVANAADLNKRVLFARFEDGQVVGRCLLAITDAGRLLAFHPYCHHPDVDFRTMALAFARELTEAMGTELVPQGRVPRLVAKDWYDDGPVDLTGRFVKLQWGGKLEDRLRLVAPLELPAVLDEELGTGFLDARSFPLLTSLVHRLDRDDLVAPLVDLALRIEGIDRFTCESLLTMAWDTGARSEARHLYARRIRASLRRHGTPALFTTPRVLAEMGDASFALRLLRRSRPRGVERDEDELDADRLLAAASAHRELRRDHRARALLARAIERFGRDPRVDTWRQALATI